MRSTLIALLAFVAVFLLAAPAQSADRDSLRKPCATPAVTQAIVDQRTAELGETGKSMWIVQDMSVSHPKLWGVIAAKNIVWVAETAGCGFLRSLVDHEWAHLQQDRKYPGRADAAYGGMDEVEIIADCVAKEFGNPDYSPYLKLRGSGCTEYEKQSARSLIELR